MRVQRIRAKDRIPVTHTRMSMDQYQSIMCAVWMIALVEACGGACEKAPKVEEKKGKSRPSAMMLNMALVAKPLASASLDFPTGSEHLH